MSQSNEEIDLIELFFKIFNFFKIHIKQFILLSIIGGTLGVGISFLSKPNYNFSFVINSSFIPKDIIKKQVEDLNTLKQQKKHLSENIAQALQEIKEVTITSEIDKDKPNTGLLIDVTSLKPIDESDFSSFLIKELSKNSYYQKYLRLRQEKLKELVANLDKQIKDYKELNQPKVNNQKGSQPVYIINGATQDLTALVKEKLNTEEQIKSLELISILKAPGYSVETKNSPIKTGIIGASIMFLLALFYNIFKSINEYSQELSISHKKEDESKYIKRRA